MRGVGNKRNLVHLVEKSVEIKLKSWEIKADFLEIKLGNQPNPPAPPTFTTYDVIFEGNHGEIKQKSETPRIDASFGERKNGIWTQDLNSTRTLLATAEPTTGLSTEESNQVCI